MRRFTCEICGTEKPGALRVRVALRVESQGTIEDWLSEYKRNTEEGMVLVLYEIDTCGMVACTKTARTTGVPGKAYPRWVPK